MLFSDGFVQTLGHVETATDAHRVVIQIVSSLRARLIIEAGSVVLGAGLPLLNLAVLLALHVLLSLLLILRGLGMQARIFGSLFRLAQL